VENYSYFACPDCGKKLAVFGESKLEEVAGQYDVPILARLPIDPSVAAAFDAGLMETVDTSELNAAVEAVEQA